MNDKITGARGVVTLYKRINGVKSEVLTSTNTIVPNANLLLAMIMGGDDTARLTNIRVYNGVTLKTFAAITSKEVNEEDTTIKYIADIEPGEFSGTYNKCELTPSDPDTLGIFSTSTFSNQTQANDEGLIITWDIIFNFTEPE